MYSYLGWLSPHVDSKLKPLKAINCVFLNILLSWGAFGCFWPYLMGFGLFTDLSRLPSLSSLRTGFEPLVLHVACRSLPEACQLVAQAQLAFPKSSLLSFRKRASKKNDTKQANAAPKRQVFPVGDPLGGHMVGWFIGCVGFSWHSTGFCDWSKVSLCRSWGKITWSLGHFRGRLWGEEKAMEGGLTAGLLRADLEAVVVRAVGCFWGKPSHVVSKPPIMPISLCTGFQHPQMWTRIMSCLCAVLSSIKSIFHWWVGWIGIWNMLKTSQNQTPSFVRLNRRTVPTFGNWGG